MTLYRFAVAGLLGLGMAAAAADEAAVTFVRDEPERGTFDSLELRPNTKQPFFVVVKNLTQQRATFTVDLAVEGVKEATFKATETVTLAADESKAVAFKPPPPPKKEVPPKTPAEAKKEADAALQAEPPTGVPVPLTALTDGRGFAFRVRVTNADGKPARADRVVKITVQHPSRYVGVPDVALEGTGRRRDLTAVVGAPTRKTDAEPAAPERTFTPPVDVRFEFPPQLGLRVADLHAGTYRRPIARTGQPVTLRAEDLPYQRAADVPVKFHFTVDGYPRAFTYSANIRRAIEVNPAANKEKPAAASAVRLFPIGTGPKIRALEARVVSGTLAVPRLATLPTKDLRFRVETDNEAPGSSLVLRIARAGAVVRDVRDLDPDEVIDLGLPKDIRVWLDPAGPEGALVCTNTTGDHVVGVDVSALRGPHELQAVLREPNPTNPGEVTETRMSYTVVVDDTPPPADDIRVGPFPKRLERGKPLPVFISAVDPDTNIERVAVVVGKPGPDGKFPPDAIVTEAVQTTLGWVAQVPLPAPPPPPPPPPPGAPPVIKIPVPPVDLTVIAENEVGLTTAKVVRIELVEPRGATLSVLVERGGRPQPGAAVTLRDADGKEKGAGLTSAKGVIRFENLAPGVYKVSAAKEDAGFGLAGYLATQIPDPPPTKAVDVVLPLAKRR